VKKTLSLKLYCLSFIFIFLSGADCFSQVIISGTVYDSTKLYVVPGVQVYSTSGTSSVTDSLGAYHISVLENDSINFFYHDKYTLMFPVKTISNYTAFDISLRIRVNEKYKLLKGVTVFSDTYKRDSLENRVTYSKIFGRENPTIRSSYEPGGPAGIDVGELIGIFQFRKNKHNLAFQKRLVQDEQERYIDYRFSSKTISRVTGLKGNDLTKYKELYRPDYLFVVTSSLAEFYEYILNTSYVFKKENGIQ
jgi:hypothetical protein